MICTRMICVTHRDAFHSHIKKRAAYLLVRKLNYKLFIFRDNEILIKQYKDYVKQSCEFHTTEIGPTTYRFDIITLYFIKSIYHIEWFFILQNWRYWTSYHAAQHKSITSMLTIHYICYPNVYSWKDTCNWILNAYRMS